MNLSPVTQRKPSTWPFYVVCDVSGSMWRTDLGPGPTPWDLIDSGVLHLMNEIDREPLARDICQLSIVAFGDQVDTLLPLTRFLDDGLQLTRPMPKQRWTDYAKVFEYLARQVEADHRRVSSSYRSKRPTVFFITDGSPYVDGKAQPHAAWRPHLDRLKALPCQPIVVALGLGRALRQTIEIVPTNPGIGCVAQQGQRPAQLLEVIIDAIIDSITLSVSHEGFVFHVPQGMERVV